MTRPQFRGDDGRVGERGRQSGGTAVGARGFDTCNRAERQVGTGDAVMMLAALVAAMLAPMGAAVGTAVYLPPAPICQCDNR